MSRDNANTEQSAGPPTAVAGLTRPHLSRACVTRSRKRSARRARKGITLFEAVAAVAIVGAVSAAALSAVGSQYRTTARAQRALVVEALATSRLDFLDLLSNDRDLQTLPDTVAQGEFPAPLDEYKWKTAVSPVSDEAGLYNVLITVLWSDGQYQLKSRAYRR
ncbi:MAG: hypothetical protein ABJB74_20330, partial [Gemmatimonas sp.]